MGSSSFNKESVAKAETIQGGDTGVSPNQADGRQFRPGSTSSPAPVPAANAPRLSAGGYATAQGATIPVSPNDGDRATYAPPPSDPMQGAGATPGMGPRVTAGGYTTTDGAVIPTSPNDAGDRPAWASGEGGNPTPGQGSLPNGATKPGFSTSGLARQGMGTGNEMPVMARGMPSGARIGSGDLRRGMTPMEADVARPKGNSGSQALGSFARGKGGYVPLDPMGVRGVPQAPTAGPGQSMTPAIPPMTS